MNRTNNADLAAKLGELEGMLEAAVSVQNKKEQEFALLTKQHDELQKQHKEVVEQFELHKTNNFTNEASSKEYMRIKKEQDSGVKSNGVSKEITAKCEQMKVLLDKTTTENRVIKEKLEEVKKQKNEVEKKVKEQIDKSLEYEKEIIRLKEKISVLQEERATNERLMKELLQRSDTVILNYYK